MLFDDVPPEVSLSEIPTPLSQIPTTRGLPLIGSAAALLRDPLGFLQAAALEHSGAGLFAVPLGPLQAYVVTRPAYVQQVLVDQWRDFGKGGGMWNAVRPLLGNGLITNEGESWLKQRRMMQPLFGHQQLAQLGQLMSAAAARDCDQLAEQLARHPECEVPAHMMRTTQRLLLETMFGTRFSDGKMDDLGEHLSAALQTMNTRLFLYFLPRWLPLPGDGRFRRAVKAINAALSEIVQARKSARAAEARGDLVTLLLQAHDEGAFMSDAQLRDELVTLFVAGNETTASGLTWLLHALTQNPDVEQQVREEVQRVLGGRPVRAQDLSGLSYMRRVIMESLRLAPPIWFFPRFALHQTQIGGHTIPARSVVLLTPYLTHRDPALWPDPERFDPERFAEPNISARHKYAYFPFGGGPRQCIGNHFAMMQSQITLTTLMQRFTWRPIPGAPPVTPASATTLKPKNGLRLHFSII